jgi:hypothetical protein
VSKRVSFETPCTVREFVIFSDKWRDFFSAI